MIWSNQLQLGEGEILKYMSMIDGLDNYGLQTQAKMSRFQTLSEIMQAMNEILGLERSAGTSGYQRAPIRAQVPSGSAARGTEPPQPVPVARPMGNTNLGRCYTCNQMWHRANQCPRPRREAGTCYGCGSREHQVRDCQQRRVKAVADSTTNVIHVNHIHQPYCVPLEINNEDKYGFLCSYKLSALVDTGSPFCLIKYKLVSENNYCQNTVLKNEFSGINGSKIMVFRIFNTTVLLDGIEMLIS